MAGAYSKEELAGLYRRRVGMVYQICLMLLKNVPDAEDALVANTAGRGGGPGDHPLGSPRGRGGVAGAALPAREGADGPLPPLLPGVQHRGDGGAHGD